MKRFVFILSILFVCSQAQAGDVNLTLGPEGDVLAWLVAGPLPNPGTSLTDCKGFEKDYLGCESSAKPVEGQKASSAKWQLAVGDTEKGLDFLPIYKPQGAAVAYAYATLVSTEPRDARLLVWSDDGVKVWLNGTLVHTNHVTRGVEGQPDKVDVKLNPGANRLLLKVDQHFGSWGFKVKVEGGSDLIETLDVQPKTKDTSSARFIRAASGKPGALDIGALIQFVNISENTGRWMPWFKEYPSIAMPIRAGQISWSAKLRGAKAARSADALSAVLRDASLDLGGRLNTALEALRMEMQEPDPLVKADPAREDYVRVADGGRYFVHADGEFFTPIGYNHNPEWQQTGEANPANDAYDLAVTDKFFKHLHDSGVNLIRMMCEAPGADLLLENPVGTFKPEQVAFLDNIVKLARKHDIKLMITPWDTFWMGHRWDINPYSSKNGGPVENKVDFITKREVIEAQKKRWKFIIDRWGNLGDVFAWELLNEADLWWEASPEQVAVWAKEMGDYVREYEKSKWGRNHLICMSISKPLPEGGWADDAFRLPGMDLATTHLYLGAANAPDEPIGPALAINKGVKYSLSQIRDNRPYIDGEDGPINRWIADEKLDDEVFHNMVWAHMASGGAGSGFRWPYRFPHHLSDGMYRHLSRMSKFAKDVPWQKLIETPSEIKVSVPEGWAACSTGTNKGALVWVASPKPSETKLSITWNGPKTIKYRCYDTKTGEWFSKGTVDNKDAFSIPFDVNHPSMAVVLE